VVDGLDTGGNHHQEQALYKIGGAHGVNRRPDRREDRRDRR